MKRLWGIAALVATTAALTGCGAAGVQAYSDSILSDQYSGEITRANIVENGDWVINTGVWQAVPMTSMGPGTPFPHPQAGAELGPTTVTVFSFGTNDANYSAIGQGYSVAAAKLYALDWMKRAYKAGSKCVIWVKGNPDAYQGQPWQASYKFYLTGFNNWLSELGTKAYIGDYSGQLRTVDWGAIARSRPANSGDAATGDAIHPNASGAAALGQAIKAQVKSCAA